MLLEVFGACVGMLVAFYFYLHMVQYKNCKCKVRLDGKVVILTGATSGIGKETAIDLARRGAKLIIPCRNVEKANELRNEVLELTGNANVVVRSLDLSSQKSIRHFARQMNDEEERIDILIHNAGMTADYAQRNKLNEDGIDTTMAINYFGPFLLTHLLIDLLKQSKQSRIVLVTSWLYVFGHLNLKRLNPVGNIPLYNYCVSKYALIIFTRELARRLKGTGITANCLHPGTIDTEIWDGRGIPPFSWALAFLRKSFFKTVKMGAQTTIHVAVSDELAGVSGKFFMDCQEHGIFGEADADEKAKKQWELSEELVNLTPTDPKI